MPTENKLFQALYGVKRYTFKGAAGEYVYANHYDAALDREAALREELASANECALTYSSQAQALQQRLTIAEQRNAELAGLLRDSILYLPSHGMGSVTFELNKRILETLKAGVVNANSVDCGECPNITDGCQGACQKSKPTASGASHE